VTLEISTERLAVADYPIPPAVSDTAEELLDIAKDAIEGVKEWASDAAERAVEKVHPAPKKRSKLPLLLLLLGLGAVAFIVLRRRMSEPPADIAPDAFGTAVDEMNEAGANGERTRVSTPGG